MIRRIGVRAFLTLKADDIARYKRDGNEPDKHRRLTYGLGKLMGAAKARCAATLQHQPELKSGFHTEGQEISNAASHRRHLRST